MDSDGGDEDNKKNGAASSFVKSKKKTAQQKTGEKVMKKLVEAVDGESYSLKSAHIETIKVVFSGKNFNLFYF